ncbi:HlyD family efflux transporter periplasmic adaptor subunit [Legionella quateirensis]|uniref:Lipoprotein n=1 Tax=Legionella quateirensis TaxID=45072 RepID=A0A378KX61_9GAMM|nr:HlyD family efflux transporter periplasmic adaptor subunit [Legionella quateirensis]KTD46479.1 lipoprotein [Legionella quateirensis]STY18739.1 lipoprotein [Legionella quateirensis]
MIHRRIWIASFILFFCPLLNSCKQQKPAYQTTGYVESSLFFVSSPAGGQLKKLFVHEGDSLNKSESIVSIEDQKPIKAPATATVHEIFYQIDEFVPPNHPIVSLLLPSQMRIIFYVPEANLNKIKLGKQVSVLIKNQKYPVKITYIANQAEYTPDVLFSEENSHKLVYKVKADVKTSKLRNELKIGQPVEVDYE